MPLDAADGDLIQFATKKETVLGTHPGGEMQIMRVRSDSLEPGIQTIESQLVTGDRQVDNVVQVGRSASGDIDTELSYGEYDDWFLGLLFSDAAWTTPPSAITGVDATASGNTFDKDAAWGNVAVGDWGLSTLSAVAGNNGYFKVIAVDTNNITIEGITLVNDATSAISIEIGSKIVNGVTQHSWVNERDYTEIANDLVDWKGSMFGSGTLRIATGEIVELSFGVQALLEESLTSSGGSSYGAAATTLPFNAVDNVVKFLEAGESFDASEVSVDINNGLTPLTQIGTLGAVDIAPGTFVVTGGLQQFYVGQAFFNKLLDFTSTSMAIVIKDENDSAYVIDLPAVRFTSGTRHGGGRNTRVVADMQYQATKDAVEGITCRFVRFA